jgi:signal transduction histidine kinase
VTSSRVSAGSADRELLRRLVEADEVVRRGIAHALHDDAVQALAASVMHLGQLPGKVQGVAEVPAYTRATENLKHGIRSARDLLLRLRAPLLADQGPGPALEQELDMVARVTGCATRVDWAVPARLDRLLETVVFRAAQEAIVNAERHAKAGAITATGHLERGTLVVEVIDDGAGFELSAAVGGGLDRARQRIELAGGSLSATSRPGLGTTVTICVPINSRT